MDAEAVTWGTATVKCRACGHVAELDDFDGTIRFDDPRFCQHGRRRFHGVSDTNNKEQQ